VWIVTYMHWPHILHHSPSRSLCPTTMYNMPSSQMRQHSATPSSNHQENWASEGRNGYTPISTPGGAFSESSLHNNNVFRFGSTRGGVRGLEGVGYDREVSTWCSVTVRRNAPHLELVPSSHHPKTTVLAFPQNTLPNLQWMDIIESL